MWAWKRVWPQDAAQMRVTVSVQYKELKLGSHSGHAKTNLSGHCVKMSGHYFLLIKVTPIWKYMIYMANKI